MKRHVSAWARFPRGKQLMETDRVSARGGRHLISVLIIVALALSWFSPLFMGESFSAVPGYETNVYPWAATNNGAVFYPQSDQAALNYPWQSYLTRSVKDGSIPYWNSESFVGQPLYSDGSSALYYPPRLALAATVSPTTAHNVLSVFHVALAGIFIYWLLVDLELSPLAALFGAVAWMFGSFTLGWLQLEVVAPVFAWLPVGLVTMRRSVLRSWRWVVGAAASIAMLFLSSHLLFADISMVIICGYGGLLVLREFATGWRRSHDWRSAVPMGRALASVGLGVGLAAVLLIPTASTLSDISRQSLSFAELSSGMLLPVSDLRYAIWPVAGPITEAKMQWGLTFSGTITAVLAIVALFLRRKGAGLGRGLAIGAVLVAIGGPVSWLAFELIPGMNIFRPYARLIFVFDLGVAVLGAVGLDALMRAIERPEFRLTRTSRLRAQEGHSRHRRGWWISRGVAVVFIAITAIQLGWYGRQINPPFLSSTQYAAFPATPLVRNLQESDQGWPSLVLPANDDSAGFAAPMLDAADTLALGVDSASGYDSSVPTRTVNLWRVVQGEQPDQVVASKLQGAFLPTFDAPKVRYALLPRLGVDRIAFTPLVAKDAALMARVEAQGWKIVYSGAGGTVLAWTGAVTGPYVVFDRVTVPSDLDALKEFTSDSFPFTQEIVLTASAGATRGEPGQARVTSAKQGVNSAVITTTSTKPGYLVVPEMWDPGWSATVNGTAVSVDRANYNQQAVLIPAGKSTVLLSYRPVGFAAGLKVTAAAVIVCLALLVGPVFVRRRRRRKEEVQREPRRFTRTGQHVAAGSLVPSGSAAQGTPERTVAGPD